MANAGEKLAGGHCFHQHGRVYALVKCPHFRLRNDPFFFFFFSAPEGSRQTRLVLRLRGPERVWGGGAWPWLRSQRAAHTGDADTQRPGLWTGVVTPRTETRGAGQKRPAAGHLLRAHATREGELAEQTGGQRGRPSRRAEGRCGGRGTEGRHAVCVDGDSRLGQTRRPVTPSRLTDSHLRYRWVSGR